jgi:alpha-tubulin suppressor-like RCC1 family protein
VSTNTYGACALRTDDAIVCWGRIDFHTYGAEPSPPAGTFRSVSVGEDHACALRTDDAVVCWDRTDTGQP